MWTQTSRLVLVVPQHDNIVSVGVITRSTCLFARVVYTETYDEEVEMCGVGAVSKASA